MYSHSSFTILEKYVLIFEFLLSYVNLQLGSTFIILFVCIRGDTILHHGGLRSKELGQL